jgi:hexosaminidase
LLYGIETLCQSLQERDGGYVVPCMQVQDKPAFEWRGLMLDCSRHFMPKEFLLHCIDVLPALRMNRLHLHFNDDHGWRMEVRAYPELTRVGAFVEREESRQGHYTQADLREIVAYAAERNITVVPEIEIPGHAYAAIKSYPDLCCTGKPIRNRGHQKDLYCAGKESTFEFLEAVLGEVMDIFPSPYIHIGGDEAPKDRWRECPACQQRMRDENLKSEEELQAYMIRRCAELLRSKGRRVIGWEEVLNGNPTTDTVVQWWRHRTHGDHALRTALARGHSAISSPNSFCYLSFPVTPDKHFRPERTSDLRKVYSAELVPNDIPAEQRARFLGAECCVWTEWLTHKDIFPMLFPRALAATELMWSDPQQRDYDTFLSRIQEAKAYWNSMGVEYGPYSSGEAEAQ